MENDEFSEIQFSAGKACSTRFPGGNLVDGLPPVASNTHAADFASRPAPNIPAYNRWFFLVFSVAVHSCVRFRFTKFVTRDPKMSIFARCPEITQNQHRNAVACSTSPLAVTRLTVYRQLHIPTQVTRPAPGPGTYVWQNRVRVKISRDSSIRFRRDVKTNTGNGNSLPHAKPQVRSCTW